MKKIISVILACAFMTGMVPVNAAKPAGLKDVEQTQTQQGVTVDIPAINEYNIIESRNFDVNISITNVSSSSKNYSIAVYSDEEKMLSENVTADANASFTKVIKVKDFKQGPQTITVKVLSAGKEISSNSFKTNVIEPYKNKFRDWYSGRGFCGYNSPYYYDLMGQQSPRTGYEWNSIEKVPGVYDFSSWEQNYNSYKNENNKIVYLAAYNNPIYNNRSEVMARQYGPKTKEEFDAYAKYVATVAKKYPEIKYFELYNEPNIGFWKPNPNVDDYTYLCEITSREVKKVRPDAVVTVGSMAGANASWTLNMYRRNAFSSFDCISYHPYVYPTKADVALQNSINGVHDLILTEGGFKEGIVTEMGWPTHEGGTGITPEQQALEFVKGYVILESNNVDVNQLYRLNDPGRNKKLNEDNFGVVFYDKTPKPTVSSVKEFNQRTQGGIHMGKIKMPKDTEAHMYLVDQRLVVVAWNKSSSNEKSHTVDFMTPVNVYDLYGNSEGRKNKVELVEAQKYIEGLSTDLIAQNLYYNMKESLDHSFMKLKFMQDYKGFSEVKDIIYKKLESMKLESMPDAAIMKALKDDYFALGDEIIRMYKDGELDCEINNLTSLLYTIYLSGRYAVNTYIASVNSNEKYELQSADSIKSTEESIKTKKADGTLSYSYAVLKYAEELYEDALILYNSDDKSIMKTGILKGWDEQALTISQWAENVSEIEKKKYDDILIQLPSTECFIETNVPKTFNVSLYNYSPEDITGIVEFVSPSGNVLGKTEKITLLADENRKIPLPALITNFENTDKNSEYTLRFVSEEEVKKTVRAPIKVTTNIDVKMKLVETNFDNINSVSVEIKNLVKTPINGKVKIKAPEGWTLESEEKNFEVEGESVSDVKFPVSQKTAVPFHFYAFEVTVEDSKGRVAFSDKLPLTFTQVVKTDTEYFVENFDGDIKSWENAYPIYLGIPKDVTSYEDWQQSDIAARVLTKWDENYLYLVVDVFDNSHINGKVGSQIWDGDCVQVSIDPNNDKDSKKYSSEDYEYGFAYTDTSGNVSYSWFTNPQSHPAGNEPSEYSVMKRDNSTKLSRYMIKLPQNAILPLNLSEGESFGYNIAVNDADFVSRERIIEYVRGTANSKNPSIYPTYVFIGNEKAPDGEAVCPIPSGMKEESSDKKEDKIVFDDINGHWAENIIKDFANNGYVNGVGENRFAPDNKVTRAEFIAMFNRVLKIGSTDDDSISMFAVSEDKKETIAPQSYFDVNTKQWYAQNIYDAKTEGIINENVANAYFYPEKEITREEVCSVIDEYLVKKGDKGENIKAINSFDDDENVSDWALKSVMNVYGNGILKGDDNNNINPQSSLTRAEAAAFLWELIKR